MANLSKKLETNLSPETLSVLETVRSNSSNSRIYLVGGVVRDLFLNREIFDVDITVEGDALNLARGLEKNGKCTIKQVQKDLRTVKAVFENGVEIDFASTRTESYPVKGQMPVVKKIGAPLCEDIQRRDFTVNALAMSLNNDDFGEVLDFSTGLADLGKKELRILHRGSFIDDPTRIIRGLKFSVRFGFKLEEETKKMQEEYLEKYISTHISLSRLKSEIEQTFSLNLEQAFNKFISQGIYKLINPDFDKKIDASEIKSLIEKYNPDLPWFVWVGLVLYDSPILNSMPLNKIEQKILTDTQKLLISKKMPGNFGIYKFFEGFRIEAVLIYYLFTSDSDAMIYLDELRHVKPEVKGEDLVRMGLKPSAEFSKILDSLLEEKLSGNLQTRAEELDFVKFAIKELKK